MGTRPLGSSNEQSDAGTIQLTACGQISMMGHDGHRIGFVCQTRLIPDHGTANDSRGTVTLPLSNAWGQLLWKTPARVNRRTLAQGDAVRR